MADKLPFESAILTFGTYKPKAGKEAELIELIRQHQPTLRKFGLLTSKEGFIVQSQDGTIIEVFEWKGLQEVQAAKQHPVISAMWEKMHSIGDCPPMKDIPETATSFPGFEVLKFGKEEV